jgi:16S rRNA (guanine(1405)-N(7))-methyltransferase
VSESGSNLEKTISAVASSKKYGSICADTIHRIAKRELAVHGTVKATTKATKRRLHQIYGAFEGEVDYEEAYLRLEAAYRAGTDDEIKATCRQILVVHSSTRERLPILEQFYEAIFGLTGQPKSILDLGCGLNPLAWPWMGLAAGVRYLALDIDRARVRFLNQYLALEGLEPLARCQDVLSQPPYEAADLALLLKLSPTLERQEAGATLRLIERLRTPCVVVSFAVASLGGRQKGMADQYQAQFLDWVDGHGWPVDTLTFETELVFVVRKRAVREMARSEV